MSTNKFKKYHIRRSEKEISNVSEIIQIIKRNNVFTLALSDNNIPYLVTMDYAFSQEDMTFYFHCAKEGKKNDIWNRNPSIWGQIIEDNGYISGECNHAYYSIEFEGKVEFINDLDKKRDILIFMINQFDENPQTVKDKFISDSSVENVKVGKISVSQFTGKKEEI